MKVLTFAAMRRWEKKLIDSGIPAEKLMLNAGRNIAGIIRNRLLAAWAWRNLRQIIVICGGGNNGGDGVVIAMELGKYFPVKCILTTPPAEMSPVARRFAEEYPAAILRKYPAGDEFQPGTLVIDAIAGTGMHGPLYGKALSWVEAINASGCPVVSVDVPTGMDENGGGAAVRADLTAATGAFKPCHFSGTAVGELEIAAITEAQELPPDDCDSPFEAVSVSDIADFFRPRQVEGHKNISGRAVIAAGSGKYSGAALLAAAGAQAGGAGMIRLVTPETALTGRSVPPEIILTPVSGDHLAAQDLPEILSAAALSDVLLAGPGMDTSPETALLLEKLFLECCIPMIADADALNLLAGNPQWTVDRQDPLLLTPHPGEALRLAPETENMTRNEQAVYIARKYSAVVILKGRHSVIAAPDGRFAVNTSGGTPLATAGSGDVLAGFLAALLCGNDAYEAAKAAAWLHGRTTLYTLCGRGTTAGELPDLLKRVCAEVSWRY